jgi:hypothetical protein
MTIYYISPQSSNDQIALDATSTVQLTETGKTTSLPLETGEEVTDHYINNNTKISMAGVISTDKSSGNVTNKTPEDYVRDIRTLKRSGRPFSVYFSDKLNPLTNCVFESISLSQSARNGTRGASSSYKVTFTVKQIRVVKAAQVVVVREARVVDAFTVKKPTGKGAQEQGEEDNRDITRGREKLEIAGKILGAE